MPDILPFLRSLMTVAGLPGHEGPVLELIRREWMPLADEVSTSRLGSLQAFKRGLGSEHPSMMIAAHMDSIGLMVSRIEGGFLRLEPVGDVDPRVLPGTPVLVHARRDLPGVVVAPPAAALAEGMRDEPLRLRDLLVDVGLSKGVDGLVSVGDLVSLDTPPTEMAGGTISGHSLDNRASVAALTFCLHELRTRPHAWDVWAVATAQEEMTYGGAATSAFILQPDLAIVIDVTHARGPGTEDWHGLGFGGGPAIGWGPNMHPYLHKRLVDLARRLKMPYTIEPMPDHSGTDAFAIQVARSGVPCMVVSIPLRYMHTAVETVVINDVLRVGRLLTEFIAAAPADFLSSMKWEDGSGNA